MRFLINFDNYSYNYVLKQQQDYDPAFDMLFSDPNSEFIKEKINIDKLREINGFTGQEQTVSYFKDNDYDEDYYISRRLMDKIVNGIKLSPIVVDDNYKILDGSHRLAAYSELWLYYSYDFPMESDIEIFKRI